jgi:sugar lactone lactonase YvrE
MRIRAGTGRDNLHSGEKHEINSSHFLSSVLTLSRQVSFSPQLAILALVLSFTVRAATQKVESVPLPGTKAFPESITSTSDGALFVGRLGDGGIVRIKSRAAESTVFVQPGAAGSRSISGVFADEASSTLWACSNDLSALGGPATGSDTGSALKGFALKTGDGKRSVLLPGSRAFCNDIAVDAKGSVYVTDSANPTILKLSAGATTFDVFAQDSAFSPPQSGGAGLDGIAFGSDGNLYVTTYTAGELFRVEVKDGRARRVTKLTGNRHLQFPDALRRLGDNSFLLIEGSGRIDRVVIRGDAFAVTAIHDGFVTPTSVAQIGTTAWVSEGQLAFFFDPSKRNSSPSLPFRIYAVPLRKEDSK